MSESELVVTREALEELQDQLYVLEAAVDDVGRDIDASSGVGELRDALDWILAAARPLAQRTTNLT